MSSRAYLIDEIHYIGELTALCDHLEEKLISCEDDGEKTNLTILLNKILTLRRATMSELLSKGKNPDPTYFCAFKHICKAFTLASEAYDSTLADEDLERLKKTQDTLAMVSSLFFGFDEFQTCGRCFADALLVEEKTKQKE